MKSIRLFFTLAGILLLYGPVNAKEWRGIKPLYSTRSDVDQLLGQPANRGKHSSIYKLGTEVATVLYASGPPCGSDAISEWQVPMGTVVSITVAPTNRVLFSQLKRDATRYKKIPAGYHPDVMTYLDREGGEAIEVNKDEVMSITYFATDKDAHLRCPEARAKDVIDLHLPSYKLDVYRDIKFEDEKARLDNFGIWLAERSPAKGYIIVYPSSSVSLAKAQARAKDAKSYLVKVRGIAVDSIVIMIGGSTDDFIVELHIVPKGAQPPVPFTASRLE